MDVVPCLRVSRCNAQHFRTRWNGSATHRLQVCFATGCFVSQKHSVFTRCLRSSLDSESGLHSKKEKSKSGCRKVEKVLQQLLESHGERWTEELREDLPHSFHRHGDLVLLGDACFSLPLWKTLGEDMWSAVAKGLDAKRLAKQSRVSTDGFRSPVVKMLLGENSWVRHVDNGIIYEFDISRCMFSAGNISEKLRVAALNCTGETVVDLYAGIGYFTLPYLVHAGAAHVHACEWNPAAVEALQKNLEVNHVSERCTVHPGDNRRLQLNGVADRVNLGLIPSSEEGWPVACRLLNKRSGGVLHVHHNVSSPLHKTNSGGAAVTGDAAQRDCGKKADRVAWQTWACETAARFAALLGDITGALWETKVLHVEHVKSYAPRVHHVVLDLECRPG